MIRLSKQFNESMISGNELIEILDLGMHSYADTFVSRDQIHLSEPVFPLKIMLDTDTGYVQLKYISSDLDRYTLYPYSYTSSNSETSCAHWDELARKISCHDISNSRILEIGSNDGYLSSKLLGKCKSIIGIDASSTMCKLAQQRNVPVICDLFSKSSADTIKKTHGLQDIVISNNVLNHANDPVEFSRAVSSLLEQNGVWIFEVPYWRDMVRNNWFDMIYHEHISYFVVRSLRYILSQAGLVIQNIEIVNYQGSSVRVVAGRGKESSTVEEMIAQEINEGLFDINTYQNWQKQLLYKRNKGLKKLMELKISEPDTPIIGVGAAAKANTFMNFYRLDSSVLHCVTDSSDQKQGKYTPLSRIPIKSDREFARHSRCYALILSWNISENLQKTVLKINPNVKFIQI